jgi:uncharacterized membrane protein
MLTPSSVLSVSQARSQDETASNASCVVYSSNMNIEAEFSSETSVGFQMSIGIVSPKDITLFGIKFYLNKSIKRKETRTLRNSVFWYVKPCCWLAVISYLAQFCSSSLKMEAFNSSEKSVNFYQTTRRCIPEDNTLQMHRHENPRPTTSM